MPPPYRVVQWATGHVGKVAIRHFVRNPANELVGVLGRRMKKPLPRAGKGRFRYRSGDCSNQKSTCARIANESVEYFRSLTGAVDVGFAAAAKGPPFTSVWM